KSQSCSFCESLPARYRSRGSKLPEKRSYEPSPRYFPAAGWTSRRVLWPPEQRRSRNNDGYLHLWDEWILPNACRNTFASEYAGGLLRGLSLAASRNQGRSSAIRCRPRYP